MPAALNAGQRNLLGALENVGELAQAGGRMAGEVVVEVAVDVDVTVEEGSNSRRPRDHLLCAIDLDAIEFLDVASASQPADD